MMHSRSNQKLRGLKDEFLNSFRKVRVARSFSTKKTSIGFLLSKGRKRLVPQYRTSLTQKEPMPGVSVSEFEKAWIRAVNESENVHRGSSLESFLEQEGIPDEATEEASKKLNRRVRVVQFKDTAKEWQPD